MIGLMWINYPQTAYSLGVALSFQSSEIFNTSEMKKENIYGYIYLTINLVNVKKYIGRHNKKKLDTFYIGSGKYFKKAVKKYGRDSFINGIIEYCESIEELKRREEYWISYYKTIIPSGYNLTKGGEGVSGYSPTKEAKIRQSKVLKKYYESHSGSFLGKKHKLESKKKNSEASLKYYKNNKGVWTGKKIPKETCDKISNSLKEWHKENDHPRGMLGKTAWNKGIPMSQEMKLRISNTKKGKVPWNKGIPMSQETKEKISKSKKEKSKNKK